MKKIDQTIEIIARGAEHLIPVEELKKMLESGKKLRVKFGIDPTSPDLHLGHMVVLSKLKQLQDLGFEIILLIGNFTARIGDPTGKSKTRPALTESDIEHNMKTYLAQVGKILDKDKLIIRYNAEWLDKLNCKELVQLCAKVTFARLTEREDFAKRIANNQPISFHELLYPIFQGYDSVELRSDIEIGGTDQLFNLIMGRYLQEQFNQEQQIVITMPLLEGTDGIQKMSKSLGNAIGIAEPADQAFGKLMSISDKLMWRYFQLLLGATADDISLWQSRVAGGTTHPMAMKKQMAHDIIAKFWSPQEADTAQAQFESLFQKHDYSAAKEITLPSTAANPIWIVDLIKILAADVKSSSQARRLIEENAVSIDEKAITDFSQKINIADGMIVKIGKHKIFKIKK